MQKIRGFFPLKYKLEVLLFTIVLFVASFLGGFQYLSIRSSLEDNFLQNRKLVHDRVLNMIKSADYVNLLNEKPIEAEAKEILLKVRSYYDNNKNINFDLNYFLVGKKYFNLYIIDSNNKVIAATDEKDIGLDFSSYTNFVQYLDKVRASSEFSAARVSLSIVEGELTKYCYIPSADGKYVFETGTLFKNESLYDSNVDFDNFEHQLLEEDSFVDSVLLYDYQGVSYKKDGADGNIKINSTYEKYFQTALETLETVKADGYYNGKKAYYEYIPYEIINAQGANERNVIEVIYNDNEVTKKLWEYLIIIGLAVIVSAGIAASFGYFMARKLIKPVEELTEGAKQVAGGNLSYKFKVSSKDEMAILGGQLNQMTEDIGRLLTERYQYESSLQAKNQEIFNQKEEISALYEETSALNEELEGMLQQNLNSYFETVRALANAIDEKDSYTGSHCERVMEYSMIIANEIELSQQELSDLKFGSILHDIGKIGISDNILNKCGKLTEEEYNEIKKHPVKGNNILKDLGFLDNCRRIINEHHERIDGKGYPNGLKGEEIYFLARIVCVADAYDAMTSSRAYRQNVLSKEEAIEELLRNKGTQFDDKVVDVFVYYLKNKD